MSSTPAEHSPVLCNRMGISTNKNAAATKKNKLFPSFYSTPRKCESIRDTMIAEQKFKKTQILTNTNRQNGTYGIIHIHILWFAFILAVLVIGLKQRLMSLAMHTFGISKSKCSKNDCLRQPENAESKSISKPSSTKARKTTVKSYQALFQKSAVYKFDFYAHAWPKGVSGGLFQLCDASCIGLQRVLCTPVQICRLGRQNLGRLNITQTWHHQNHPNHHTLW